MKERGLYIDGRIILKGISNKYNGIMWTAFTTGTSDGLL
jgi:hypothetical protein